MTLYKKDQLLNSQNPLKYPFNSDAYELRLIDEEDAEYFKPDYEIGCLDRKENIGEFESLAFVQARNFK